MRHGEHQCCSASARFSPARQTKKCRKRPVFLGKHAVSHETRPGRHAGAGDESSAAFRLRIFPKIVQNSPAQTQRASLLRSAMHMPENNYPQTYPTLEDMLVSTNITEIAGQENPRRK
ncbi:MAG: hypothetical protein J0I68_13165 [Achromobacter sp.]|jgi:hypothetical protein|uniref:hypothetical protein n=1 Tax=Achromobacter TaxID=222 RepID=UPI0012E15F68|nr:MULTISPECIES: hypothetical protein [Achromobacter]MBN9639486.1 hypothetical protein [Achromobacter sp.]